MNRGPEELLHERLESAEAEYKRANERFKQLIRETPGGLPHPDFVLRRKMPDGFNSSKYGRERK
jgi:hypothetical protein